MTSTPHKNSIINRMFVVTADENYVLARLAYFSGLHLQFFWLSLHAIEKYLKAILLFNGQSAKNYLHNLSQLFSAVQRLRPDLTFGPLYDPKIDDYWFDYPLEKFIKRLDKLGHASNRYLSYGYSVSLDDLLKVDQLVWFVRRYCLPFHMTVKVGTEYKRFDWVSARQRSADAWRHTGNGYPLEAIMDGKRGGDLREIFVRLNRPFAPDEVDGQSCVVHDASAHSPLARYIEMLRASATDPALRAEAAEVVAWALEHIKLVKDDARHLRDVLAAYNKNK